jgi:exodeoxyribonuclease VIII
MSFVTMVDLETLGTKPNSVILSIGAVTFDPENAKEDFSNTFYVSVDPESCQRYGLVIDASTVMWWLKQSKEAQESLFKDVTVDLPSALGQFAYWYSRLKGKVYGNGAAFDNTLLANAYATCNLKTPWAFWDDRCYRTVKANYPKIKADIFEGTKHDALSDAVHQAKHLYKIAQQTGISI